MEIGAPLEPIKNESAEIGNIEPGEISVQFLQSLSKRNHRTLIARREDKIVQWNLDALGDNQQWALTDLPVSHTMIHSHINSVDKSLILPRMDASSSELYDIVSPGFTVFLVAGEGIIHYGAPTNIKGEVRDWIFKIEQKLSGFSPQQFEAEWNKQIHQAGFIRAEARWEDAEAVNKLVATMKELISTPKTSTKNDPSTSMGKGLLSRFRIRK